MLKTSQRKSVSGHLIPRGWEETGLGVSLLSSTFLSLLRGVLSSILFSACNIVLLLRFLWYPHHVTQDSLTGQTPRCLAQVWVTFLQQHRAPRSSCSPGVAGKHQVGFDSW